MGRRNRDRYSLADWRAACPTVADLRRAGWVVLAVCPICDLQVVADLERIERVKGPGFRLWGKTARCRRRYCTGEAAFFTHPPGATMEFRMEDG